MPANRISSAGVTESVQCHPEEFVAASLDRDLALRGEVPEAARQALADLGFLVIERLLPLPLVERLMNRFEPLFQGEFDTGVYPDEWYWREGMSLPDVTRHMGNSWKSDTTIASVVLSSALGRFASRLMGWPGARIGTDTIWWKPPGASEIAFHQDDTYGAYLDPPETLTCWLALDDSAADAAPLEYVVGSHRWPLKRDIGEFHTPSGDYRAPMREAAAQAGEERPQLVRVLVPAGSCIVHVGRVWHGSDRNRSPILQRRSIGTHLLRSDCRFKEGQAGYTYGRYKRDGDTGMDENFFPILWTDEGYRTPFLDRRYRDALAEEALP